MRSLHNMIFSANIAGVVVPLGLLLLLLLFLFFDDGKSPPPPPPTASVETATCGGEMK